MQKESGRGLFQGTIPEHAWME